MVIQDYISHNDHPNTDTFTLWETLKATIRGIVIGIKARINKKLNSELNSLEKEIKLLEVAYAGTLEDKNTLDLLIKNKYEYNTIVSKEQGCGLTNLKHSNFVMVTGQANY